VPFLERWAASVQLRFGGSLLAGLVKDLQRPCMSGVWTAASHTVSGSISPRLNIQCQDYRAMIPVVCRLQRTSSVVVVDLVEAVPKRTSGQPRQALSRFLQRTHTKKMFEVEFKTGFNQRRRTRQQLSSQPTSLTSSSLFSLSKGGVSDKSRRHIPQPWLLHRERFPSAASSWPMVCSMPS
jgi:hypothetical protein